MNPNQICSAWVQGKRDDSRDGHRCTKGATTLTPGGFPVCAQHGKVSAKHFAAKAVAK